MRSAVNIEIMRTFVRMRGGSPDDELTKVKRRVESHDTAIVGVVKSISELKNVRETRVIGPVPSDDEEQ